jgi:hypothetical protein
VTPRFEWRGFDMCSEGTVIVEGERDVLVLVHGEIEIKLFEN